MFYESQMINNLILSKPLIEDVKFKNKFVKYMFMSL